MPLLSIAVIFHSVLIPGGETAALPPPKSCFDQGIPILIATFALKSSTDVNSENLKV